MTSAPKAKLLQSKLEQLHDTESEVRSCLARFRSCSVFGRFSLDDNVRQSSLVPDSSSVELKRSALTEVLASISSLLDAENIVVDMGVAKDPSLKHWTMAVAKEQALAADQNQLLEVAKYLFLLYSFAPSCTEAFEKLRQLIISANDLLQQMA